MSPSASASASESASASASASASPSSPTGQIQVLKTKCTTTDPNAKTTFAINQPPSDVSAATESGCTPGAGVSFTLTNAETGSTQSLTTGENGQILVSGIAPGTYTLTEDSNGATSDPFEIVAGKTTVILVTNFTVVPKTTIEIIKQYCPGATGTSIIGFDPSDVPAGDDDGNVSNPSGGCQFGNATFTITNTDTGEIVFTGSTGDDGIAVVELPAGNYTVTETSPGQASGTVTVEDGMNTKVLVTNPTGSSTSPSASASASESASASASPSLPVGSASESPSASASESASESASASASESASASASESASASSSASESASASPSASESASGSPSASESASPSIPVGGESESPSPSSSPSIPDGSTIAERQR